MKPQETTKFARQVVDPPGDDVKCFVVCLHGIVHTRGRIFPVEGIDFF